MYGTTRRFGNRIGLHFAIVCFLGSAAFAGPAEDQWQVAAKHYQSQRWQAAVDEFESLLDQFPDFTGRDNVLFFQGEALVQLGKYADAEVRFRKFVLQFPKHRFYPQALFRLGESSFLTGQLKEARRDLERFHEQYPQHDFNGFGLTYLGEMALGRNEPKTADELFRKCLEKFPNGPLADECRFGLGRALEAQGDAVQAMRFYRFLTENELRPLADDAALQIALLQHRRGELAEAETALSAFAAKFPKSPFRGHAAYWLGATRLARGDPARAAETFSKAAQEFPQHPLSAAIHFSAGDTLRKLGRADEAKPLLERVGENWPDSEWADDSLQLLVEIAFEAGEYDEVRKLAESFVDRFPNSTLRTTVARTLGRSLLKQERFDEAQQQFESLLASAGDDAGAKAQAMYLLALTHLGAKRPEDAIRVLAEFDAAAVPQSQADLVGSVQFTRAMAFVALGQHAEAIGPLRECLQEGRTGTSVPRAKCRAQLAVSLARVGKLDEAAEAMDEFQAQHPGDENLLPTTLFVAEAAYQQENKAVARRLFQRLAAQGNPPEYVARGLAGLAWTQSADEALAATAELMEKFPDNPQAAEGAVLRGKAFEQQQKFDAALSMYQFVLEKHPQSPHAPAALFAAAQVHVRQGQLKEADRLFERLVKEHGKFPQLDAALYQWAWVLTDLQRCDEADAAFERLHNEFTRGTYWADATYRLAERAVKADRHERAIQLVDQLAEAECDANVKGHALYLRGQIAAAQSQWRDVSGPMNRLLTEFPNNRLTVAAQYWIAEAHYRLNEFDEAGQRFADLALATAERREEWLAMVPLRRAQVLGQQKKWDEAFEIASGIAARYPDFKQQYEVDYLLGRCLATKAKFSDARVAFERVIRSPSGGRTETAAMAQWMIGETYFQQRNYDDAIRAYHRVESLFAFPRWQAAALLQAGKCHEARGERQQAVELYGQILRDYPETAFTEKAAERLRTVEPSARSARK